ncbi:MAG TPA: DUF4178 domain-containing protein [Vicinamibacterales bacterium]|jgi:hypothetical protein
MASPSGGRPPVAVRSLSCPACGATTAVRLFGHAVNVVCQSCHTLLDARDAGVTILQKFTDAVRDEPQIPLGTRGTLHDVVYEVVGFQVRQVVIDGTRYQWREYLLFNPYKTFHYLTEYDGHWNFVTPVFLLPGGDQTPGSARSRTYRGQTFRHFQTATATTVFVLGEFPWQVRVGEKAIAADYVAPPRMISAEISMDKEVTWSLSEYLDGRDVWKGLALQGSPPRAKGVFANQPSPHGGSVRRMWTHAAILALLALLIWSVEAMTSQQKQAFTQSFVYNAQNAGDASLVTPMFELDGRPSAVRVETAANIDNQWIFVGYSLINDETGQTFDFGREVSYYHGYDDGESWTEGSRTDAATLPAVPAGRYFLRIEPDGDRAGKSIQYRVTVVRGVTTALWLLIALGLIVVPPIVATWRAVTFERLRWQESGGVSSDSEESDG